MDGIHDLGGRVGYGPIDVHEPEEQFHHAWEARTLSIIRAFTRPEPWSLDWFRQVRELIEPTDYLSRPYYDQWLQSYAAMTVYAGAATVREIATGKSERPLAGLPPPASRVDVARERNASPDSRRTLATPPKFAAGAAIRTHRDGPVGHTRLPQYARDRVGRVHIYRGGFVLPDTNERDDGPGDHLYTIAFAAGELWPEAKGRPDTVFIDLWESYLNPPDSAVLPRQSASGAPVFAEAWQAEVLSLAHGLIAEGLFTAADWATALGAALRAAERDGAPDTESTYYAAALAALESLIAARSPPTASALPGRIDEWRRAYRNTPHGQPVELAAAQHPSPDHGDDHDHHHHDH